MKRKVTVSIVLSIIIVFSCVISYNYGRSSEVDEKIVSAYLSLDNEYNKRKDSLIEMEEFNKKKDELNSWIEEREKLLSQITTNIETKKDELNQLTSKVDTIKNAPITLSTGFYTAGADFPAGKYNIVLVSGNGNLFANGSLNINEIFGTSRDNYIKEYRNAVFSSGDTLEIVSGLKVSLIRK